MSLPIDSSAITALSRAEHDYGERLMTLATERATMAGASHVHEADIEWAAKYAAADMLSGLADLTGFDVMLKYGGKKIRCVCADRLGVAQPGERG